MHVQQAYEYCKGIIETNSKTFAKAFHHLPKHKRQAVWAVYAFCRQADDIVDEESSENISLEDFQTQLNQFADGELITEDPLWIALKDTFKKYPMDLQPFYEMLQGQKMDLNHSKYKTLSEVLDYSYHVASTVGLMLLPILAPDKTKELRESAVKLGYAMQITNILRDIGEDYEKGRRYLPEELMKKHGYTESMLSAGIVNQAFIHLWEDLAGCAEGFYREALKDMHLYPLPSRVPVQAAAHFYERILHSARANNYDVFQQRAFVSLEEKKTILNGLAMIK
ncbi:phytoene/squalene synthase family protein [Alkalicoccus daliensis]|uniref:Phytoene synthase n=1 Tax=Alkalicoccus daliensis TaxID=745820 RepID=A0A1H0B0X0_9BACI|nr:phytoene/squalene synthase family protein [Alkalicoccus daliensis]SDN39284.1 phytoene synthase [Alkalicoccus daliensis]